MFTLKRQRLVKVLLIGLLAVSVLAPAASATTAGCRPDNGGGTYCCWQYEGIWHCKTFY